MILGSDQNVSKSIQYAPISQALKPALGLWGIDTTQLTFISDTENIIFHADSASGPYCVRVYKGQPKTIPEICGELYWLQDLKRQTHLNIPEPLKTTAGKFVYQLFVPERDTSYFVVLFYWLPGQVIGAALDPALAKQLGHLMADLHTHAASFTLPAPFFRDDSDWRCMGHLLAGLSPTGISRIQAYLSPTQIRLCDEAAQRAATIIDGIDSQHNFGIIHSDLHANNCLFTEGQIGIIDFDDCQFAPFTNDMAITISSFDSFPDKEQLHAAFLAGYSEKRALPAQVEKEIEAFRIERRLRLIRWVATWPTIDYFPNGWDIIGDSLAYIGLL